MYKRVLIIAAVTIAVLGSGATAFAQQETCPKDNGWVKVDNLSGFTYTFTNIPSGYEVTSNCYKASTKVVYGQGATVTSNVFNSPQGVTCTAPGVPHQGCAYQALSHASFLLEKIDQPEDPGDPETPVTPPAGGMGGGTTVATATPVPAPVATPQVDAPKAAVNAGGGAIMTSMAALVGSMGTLGYGVAKFRKSQQ